MPDTNGRNASGILPPRADLDLLAAETALLLHRAGVQLAIAEAGTGGDVADCLSSTPQGPAIVTSSRMYGDAEALAAGLRVSDAKVNAFGAVSSMVVAEAAAELIDTYEGGWGLVVMIREGNLPAGNPDPGRGVSSEGGEPGFIALGTPSSTTIQQRPRSQIIRTVLELLGEQAQRRLQNDRPQPGTA